MATIRKRTWLAPDGAERQSWQVDYRDAAGKRRSKQFDKKRDAEAHLDGVKAELRAGTHVHARDSITLSEAADMLVTYSEAEKLQRSTVKRYRELGDIHLKPRLGARKLSELTLQMVKDLKVELLGDLSRPMAAKVLNHLSMVLNHAVEMGRVGKNIARTVKVEKPKRDSKLIEPPDRADLKAMIKAATDDERALIMVLIVTGLRSSELRGLRWQDIDLKAATITVAQRADEWGVIDVPKSEAGKRTIPIPPKLVAELKRWKLRSPPSAIGLAFPSKRGTPMHHGNLLRRVYFPLQVRAGLGVPKLDRAGEPLVDDDGAPVLTGKYGLHDLRHAAASGWIAHKIDLKRLQVWIGHENIQLTLDTYGHLLVDKERDAALALKASRDLLG